MIFVYNLKNLFNSFLSNNFNAETPGGNVEQTEKHSESVSNESLESQDRSPEEQEIIMQLDSLEEKYEILKNTGKITGQISKQLMEGLTSDPEIKNDPEAEPTIAMFRYYKNLYTDTIRESQDIKTTMDQLKTRLTQASNNLEHSAGVDYNEETGEINDLEFDKEKLKSIDNKEFLSLKPEARLQYITQNNIDSSDVSNGNIDNLEFSFTYEGDYNRELYLETTAGQVLPKEVGSVVSGGIEYSRSSLKGEFFNGNKRLTIHEGTNLDISSLRSQDELSEISSGINQKLEGFEGKAQIMIAKESLSRGIEPDMVMETFESILGETPDSQYELRLEELFTQVERIRGDYGLEKNSQKLREAIVDQNGDGSLDAYSKFNSKIDFSNIELREGEKGLLDMIAIFESGGNYNSIYGNSNQSKIDFTSMSIGQVQDYQRQFVNSGQPSSAIGKYQFISSTLKATAQSTGLGMDAKFSPENQDKMGLYLLKQRGLDSFMNGSMSLENFQRNLSMEWASIPEDMSGKSYYAGDGLNKAHLASANLRSYLVNMKNSHT